MENLLHCCVFLCYGNELISARGDLQKKWSAKVKAITSLCRQKIATQSGKNRQNVRNRSGMWINSLKTELLLLFFSRS